MRTPADALRDPRPGELNKDALNDLYLVCLEMQEAWAYFSEYDVPINLKTKLDAAIAKAEGGAL